MVGMGVGVGVRVGVSIRVGVAGMGVGWHRRNCMGLCWGWREKDRCSVGLPCLVREIVPITVSLAVEDSSFFSFSGLIERNPGGLVLCSTTNWIQGWFPANRVFYTCYMPFRQFPAEPQAPYKHMVYCGARFHAFTLLR